ncbi:MAG: hypothetical protein HQ546_04730 [Planctomycetes bacterium]|nr:hypothetical protein [Planctomycetota bacterium]
MDKSLPYAKPKILLLDMPEACGNALRTAGYNGREGSFGKSYKVDPSDSFHHVSQKTCTFPNIEEQEIVVANIAYPGPTDTQPNDFPGEGVSAICQLGTWGVINPRAWAMEMTQKYFNRIFMSGGIFIVFLGDKYIDKYYRVVFRKYCDAMMHEEFQCSNWSFLYDLDLFCVQDAHGEEMFFDKRTKGLCDLLTRGASNASYSSTIDPPYQYRDNWISLAKNKYDQCIAGLLSLEEPKRRLLLLPQMPNIDQVLVELMENWCSQWNPAFFPHLEGARWVHREEYEIPQLIRLRKDIDAVHQTAGKQVAVLEGQIDKVRRENADWYMLLNGTGDDLVKAVIRTLKKLGFTKVIDVDEQARKENSDTSLREDIQIHDSSPILVVDVKGVNGHPDDEESRQAEKHATMRSREWDRTDVQPLTIINHQRHLPPYDRDATAYRPEIIDNAVDTQLGLMTTWDLFRILRNKEALAWPPGVVLPIFYRIGRIEPIPDHYTEVGRVEKVWQQAFRLIPTHPIRRGIKLAVEVGDCFDEIVADSLQIDSQPVDEIPTGLNGGIGCDRAGELFREGMRVFAIGAAQ